MNNARVIVRLGGNNKFKMPTLKYLHLYTDRKKSLLWDSSMKFGKMGNKWSNLEAAVGQVMCCTKKIKDFKIWKG